MSKIKGKQLEVPENEDPQKEMEELKKIIYDFEKGVVEKYMKEKEDNYMSKIKEIFGVEIGETFNIIYKEKENIIVLTDCYFKSDNELKIPFMSHTHKKKSEILLKLLSGTAKIYSGEGQIKCLKEKEGVQISIIKELFGLNIGEKFSIDCGDCEYYNCSFVLNGEWAELIRPFGPDKNRRNKQEEAMLLEGLAYGKYKIVKAKKPILDDVEKKFIGNIIKPFDVKDITKVKCTYQDKLFIIIRLTNGEEICLPFFSLNSKMYNGMKWDKPYTPKQLGL